MENASKALVMAGSILIAVMLISSLVYMYNKLSENQAAVEQADALSKYSQYGTQFEQYNTTIYGSELLSLANLKLNYNYTQSTLSGYVPIDIEINIAKERKENGKLYFSPKEYSIDTVRRTIDGIEDDIANYEDSTKGYENKKEKGKGKQSVQYYAQLNNRQIASLFEIDFTSDEADYEVGDKLLENRKTKELMNKIQEYTNIRTMYTAFKNTRFECTDIKYDDMQRVVYMHFRELSD